MELKQYQLNALDNLTRYLDILKTPMSAASAYTKYWTDKHVRLGLGGMPYYSDSLGGVPDVCMKVPTGGGKTFIACNAIKRIYDAMPNARFKAVVWLVPSETILTQTLKALSDSQHPYRQAINRDFQNRVEVYNKEQLLNGQNINPTVVAEQLSIFVLSYDSFRATTKDGLRAYRENSNLAAFANIIDDPSVFLPDVDKTALIHAIRFLNPVAIVDESHHATSNLSVQMLKTFYPCFVLDLTATPKEKSNIITFVDPLELKRSNMVKLPVIVYNRRSQEDVFADTINIRNKLEVEANAERASSGKYIRPIALFQAEPRSSADNTTFEQIKRCLIELHIPEDQIAIKTANVNDLRNVDLLSEDCPIRYIITVNALKEGWDCPFAYVLATIANRSSIVDVEQIIGRILRLPHTRKNSNPLLNISYVLTSSADFLRTLEKVVSGLNRAGFSAKDYRAEDVEEIIVPEVQATIEPPTQVPVSEPSAAPVTISAGEDVQINVNIVRGRIEPTPTEQAFPSGTSIDPLLSNAIEQEAAFDHAAQNANPTEYEQAPTELRTFMNVFHIKQEFEEAALALRLPQFHISSPQTLFSAAETRVLEKEALYRGFTLRDKDTQIDFSSLSVEIGQVDVEESAEHLPRAWRTSATDTQAYVNWMRSQPSESRLAYAKQRILHVLSRNDAINDNDLFEYVGRVIRGLDSDQIVDLQESPFLYANKIKMKIDALLAKHSEEQFNLMIEQGRIVCKPSWQFPTTISPSTYVSTIPNSLYSREEDMNGWERDVVWAIANEPNILWWHRNMARSGFSINGYINAYPDIIAMTRSGKILMIEPKGDHLDNAESKKKVEIGRTWQNNAGVSNYRYYMVYRNTSPAIEGAYQFDRFMEIIRGL